MTDNKSKLYDLYCERRVLRFRLEHDPIRHDPNVFEAMGELLDAVNAEIYCRIRIIEDRHEREVEFNHSSALDCFDIFPEVDYSHAVHYVKEDREWDFEMFPHAPHVKFFLDRASAFEFALTNGWRAREIGTRGDLPVRDWIIAIWEGR
jgi:hypothetical protein